MSSHSQHSTRIRRRVWRSVAVTAVSTLGVTASVAAAGPVVASQTTPPRELVGIACVNRADCFAVGNIGPDSRYHALIEHWDGNTWSKQSNPSPAQSGLGQVACVDARHCVAVGYHERRAFAMRWNGTVWSTMSLPSRDDAGLSGISCVTANDCTAVGGAADEVTLAEHWNGLSWKIMKSPNPSGAIVSNLQSVSCPAVNDCVAVGDWVTDAGPEYTLIEHWNGATWKIEKSPNPFDAGVSELGGISCPTTSHCTAVGGWGYDVADTHTLVEQWDGSTWKVETSPSPNPNVYPTLAGVSCVSVTECAAIGDTYDGVLALHRGGGSWKIEAVRQPHPLGLVEMFSVSCPDRADCFAVGLNDGNVNPSVIEHRNGSGEWALQVSA